VGLEEARKGPNAGTRNRRNEARLLLLAFADSDHGRDYKGGPGNGQTDRRCAATVRGYAGRNIKAL
jgi:hypothetical protein